MTTSLQTASGGNFGTEPMSNFFEAIQPTANAAMDSGWAAGATALFTRRAANTYAESRRREAEINVKSVRQSYAADGTARISEDLPLPTTAIIKPVNWSRAATFYAIQEWEGYVDTIEDDQIVVRLVDLTAGEELASEKAIIPLAEFTEDDIRKLKPGAVFRWAIGYQRSARGTKMRVSNIIFRDLPRWTKSELTEADREAADLSDFLNAEAAENMLLHSREGSGEHRPVNINALVEDSLAYHGARAEKQGFNITLERSFDQTVGEVDVFPQDIMRVLLNLISNAFYAATKRKAQAGNIGYEPTLAVVTKNLGDRVEISIRDNGTGIPPDVRERIFNPFFSTKPAGEGTGLGLSISHEIIVKQHGGSIEVDTQPGEFTKVRIVLPRKTVTI